MAEHDLDKLLGGFAADTLTAEERQQLYAAALQDQRLFDALADEQALKELLTDSAVRRRLLDALERPAPASGAGSWLEWFRRPTNLALAGGLATAVFAVVLGTKVYQDSLTRSAQSDASETAAPTAPSSSTPTPTTMPPQKSVEPSTPESIPHPEKKESISDSTPMGIPTVRSQAQHTSDATTETARAKRLPASEEKRAEVQPIVPDKAAGHLAPSVDRPLATSSSPSAALSESTPEPVAPPVPAAGVTALATGARALFYGGPSRSDAGPVAQEAEAPAQSSGEKDSQSSLLKRKLETLSPLRAKPAPTPPKPLALRYKILARTVDGQEQALDQAAAANSTASLQLVVEANQESYLQIWEGVGSSTPRLLIPQPDSGRISMKLQPGQHPRIALPPGKGTFLIRLARAPFGPITKQEAALLDRPVTGQTQEAEAGVDGREGPATYVAATDLSSPIQALLDLTAHR